MNWTEDRLFLPKYAERMRVSNVRRLNDALVARGLAAVFEQLRHMPKAEDKPIPKKPLSPQQWKASLKQLREDLQKSLELCKTPRE